MWSNFKPAAEDRDGRSTDEGEVCASVHDVVTCVREVCVLALLHWAATWSGAAASRAAAPALCANVAHFLESGLILVHVPSANNWSRENWLASDARVEEVTAVWLEEVAGCIEWTVVQKQQHQGALSEILKIIADACNKFPQYPALRSLGESCRAMCNVSRIVTCDV
jgi:hypothetical protein